MDSEINSHLDQFLRGSMNTGMMRFRVVCHECARVHFCIEVSFSIRRVTFEQKSAYSNFNNLAIE